MLELRPELLSKDDITSRSRLNFPQRLGSARLRAINVHYLSVGSEL